MRSSVMPLYHRVAAVLRQRIQNGQYPVDSQLPTVEELAEMFSVSKVTVRQAVNTLADEGLVDPQHGRGTFVLALSDPPRLQATFGEPLAESHRVASKTLRVERDATFPEFVARRLQMSIQTGSVIHRTRTVDEEPVDYTMTHLPASVVNLPTVEELRKGTVVSSLINHGIPIAQMSQTIRVAVAGPTLQRELEIELGSPVLHITALLEDTHGSPLCLIRAWYRPDRYEYTADYLLEAIDDDLGRVIWTQQGRRGESVRVRPELLGHSPRSDAELVFIEAAVVD